ncbi:MAG: DUF3035 domain-containing protein [Alphaproteobacteria bacterium]
MKKKSHHHLLSTGILLTAMFGILAGCSSTSGKISAFAVLPPDEFIVTSNPPLTIPPGDALLPVPLDEKKNTNSTDPSRRGLQTIFGDNNNSPDNLAELELQSSGLSTGDIALLRAAKALKADPTIRQQLTADLKKRKGLFEEIGEYIASTFSSDTVLTAEQKAVLNASGEKKNIARPGVILVE